jgi:hypothetical protein
MGATLFGAAVLWFVFSWFTDRELAPSDPNSNSSLSIASARPSVTERPPPSRNRTGISEKPAHNAVRPATPTPDYLVETLDEIGSGDPEATEVTLAEKEGGDPDAGAREANENSLTRPAERTLGTGAKAGSPTEVLDMPVGRDFKYMPIQDVVNYLTETTGVPFQLDMKSLWFDQGTTKNMPVTIDSEKMTIREFLDQVVTKQMKAVYQLRDDKIVIVSRKAANKKTSSDTP